MHFEGEMVLVIGKKTKNISEAEAENAIFAFSVGIDLTERTWQSQYLLIEVSQKQQNTQ